MFTPIKPPGPPPDLQQSRLKQWLQDTFKSQSDTLRGLILAHNIAKPTYGPIVALDLSQGAIQHVIATDANNFTIQAPINIGPLAQWQLVVDNQSSGNLGNVTFGQGINQFGFAAPGAGGRAIATFQVDSGTSYQVGSWQGSPVAIYNVPYGPSVTPDLSKGIIQEITATDSNAFTINAPVNSAQASYWELVIKNQSGGALGAATFDPSLKLHGFSDPGNGFRTSTIVHQEGGFTHQDAPFTSAAGLQVATVSLTAAQIAASAAVQLSAAPSAGTYIVPVQASISATAGGFTGSTGTVKFGYGSALNNPFVNTAGTALTNAGPAIQLLSPSSGLFQPAANLIAQPVFFRATGFAGGGGTVEVSLLFYATSA